jgi:DNA-binding CsgD family transcriptional regulator
MLTGSGGASPSRRRLAVTNCDTERTVELHLTHAYQKLRGISRGELAAALTGAN